MDNSFFKDIQSGISGNLVGPNSEIFKEKIHFDNKKYQRFFNSSKNIFPLVKKEVPGPLCYDGEIPDDEFSLFCNPDLRGIKFNNNDIFPKGN